MRHSETFTTLASALAKAQSEITDPAMSGEGQVGGGKTTARKYPYALLSDVLVVARLALGKNGIFFSQSLDIERNVMLTRLVHSSGEWIEFDYPMAPRNSDPQRQGSANTYARRYALMSILGVAGEKDDDGAAAKTKARGEEAHKAGMADGRRWVVSQLIAKARDGYSGAGFAKQVKDAEIPHSLENLKLWCLWAGRDKPSRMQSGQRDQLVRYLGTAAGAASWEKFVGMCGPLSKPKKKAAAKVKVPEGAAGVVPPTMNGDWTDDERDEFMARIKDLDWKWEEIAGWCIANQRGHPADMMPSKRAKLLEWVADKGGETILAWIQGGAN